MTRPRWTPAHEAALERAKAPSPAEEQGAIELALDDTPLVLSAETRQRAAELREQMRVTARDGWRRRAAAKRAGMARQENP